MKVTQRVTFTSPDKKVVVPLFDFFKKQSKEQSQNPSPEIDKELMSPEMQKKRYEAAMEFVKELQEKIPLLKGKPHAGTVLAIAARIAGTNLYRAMNYGQDVKPRTWESKPEKQTPIYIRLIIWLKKNASAHGYEQSGNRWIRK